MAPLARYHVPLPHMLEIKTKSLHVLGKHLLLSAAPVWCLLSLGHPNRTQCFTPVQGQIVFFVHPSVSGKCILFFKALKLIMIGTFII